MADFKELLAKGKGRLAPFCDKIKEQGAPWVQKAKEKWDNPKVQKGAVVLAVLLLSYELVACVARSMQDEGPEPKFSAESLVMDAGKIAVEGEKGVKDEQESALAIFEAEAYAPADSVADVSAKVEKTEVAPIIKSMPKPAPKALKATDLGLEPVDFAELPQWGEDNLKEFIPVFIATCNALSVRGADMPMSPKWKEFGKVGDWENICTKLTTFKGTREAWWRLLEDNLQAYQFIPESYDEGLFTGYYNLVLKGSEVKTATFSVPVPSMPEDLVKVTLAKFGIESPKTRIIVKNDKGEAIPYPTRAEIEAMPIKNKPVVWINNPVDLFFLQMQGSGKVVLPDGKVVKLGYAASNGRDFSSIGQMLLDEQLISPYQTSHLFLRKWLLANLEKAKEVMAKNDRYVFFKKVTEADSPLGVNLVPKRSLAVDKEFIPLGVPLWLDTSSGSGEKIQRMVFAHDVGCAIKGKVRGDFYWGADEEAFKKGGSMKEKGTYYVLLPKR